MLDMLWWLIYVAIFVTSLFALVDASRTPAQAFPAMDKQTKKLWVGLLAVGTFVAFSAVFSSIRFFVFIALIATLIYLLDVRPAVRSIGRNEGPYGRW
ncbi:DUF2516 family protein [Streptomonospora wellingtoniae]|uniref:DUF2516 family protein n=1 Tax=Streptomonospora wellingtoniae TaxID=3075544 RepID=A0ABU2KYX1_9ACTN|nr:DUF2516 family protein [Streptomonospora sp. DSM 45055]MDT0304519.1 DUF2516 family protein [Streptomonospora sp. DSM 45055]